MKTKTKRILSIVCALVMCVTLLPTSISALAAPAEGETPASTEAIVEEGTTAETEAETEEETSEPASAEESEPESKAAAESAADDVTKPAEETEPVTLPAEETTAPPADEATNGAAESTGDAEILADPVEAELIEGVNIIKQGAENTVYNIGEGQVVMISNQGAADPIVFTNCTFNLAGGTVKISGNQDGISYNNGEVVTKLWIGGNVQFNNCTFVTADGAAKTTGAGYDAAIYFFGGNIELNSCTLTAEGYNGQFLGLYGSEGAVTFNDSNISTVGNKNGWSYAMYGGSVLKLNRSTMTATGMSTDSGNINAFYSGDNRTGYDAIYFTDSTIDFSDNRAGGFAINNVNIHVVNSDITVNNNSGNACNSGYWIVSNDSTITMNGNRGGHALSCIGFEMTDSTLEILHNGYAGVYIQSRDSSLSNCTVDIRCNGEKLLSYTAGDLWLNGHKLTVNGGTSKACEGSAWLGGVGRRGAVETTEGTTVVAYDLNSNAADNLKSNTAPVLTNASLALNGDEDKHLLLLNPFMVTDYARGNAEKSASNNDADLFADDNVSVKSDILGQDVAKIGELTTAQLSHHRYDWENGEVKYVATSTEYGAVQYSCTDVCAQYTSVTAEHPHSFDCSGTYVYTPLVGLAFDGNAGEDYVFNMPDAQNAIEYGGSATEPTMIPNRSGYTFTGWYTDASCEMLYDFSTTLTDNWTVVYAGWEKNEDPDSSVVIDKTATDLDPDDQTTVTLKVGADQAVSGSDVVFVLDKSTSVEVKNEALAMLEELKNYASTNNYSVKVGLVTFNNNANNTDYNLELTKLDDTSYNTIETIFGLEKLTSGTNIEAGIRAGMAMLEGDATVLDTNKHLVLVTDGVSYMWGTEAPQTIYVELNNTKAAAVDMVNDYYAYRSNNYNAYKDAALWMAAAKEGGIEEVIAQYQTDYTVAFGNDVEKYIPVSEECPYSSLEAAVYMAGKAWQEAADRGYELYAFSADDYVEKYPWAPNFISGLDTISGTAALYTDNDNGVAGMFDNVKNTVLYEIQKGRVIDVIGSDFDLTDVSSFTLTVGGVEQTKTVSGNTVNFGTADGEGQYPYSVTYYPNGNGAETREYFEWSINVPVESAKQLALSYNLKLVNKSADPGTYTVPTNEEAYIEYTPTVGDDGRKDFPVPEVDYEVKEEPSTEEPTKPTEPETTAPTQPSNPSNPNPPQPQNPSAGSDTATGDTAPVGMLFAAALAAAAAIVLVVLKKKGVLDRQ